MNYGDRLKKLREQKKLSQQQLADRLNINRSTYARYELNQTQPDIETLKLIADFYQVSTDYIIGRTMENYPELTSKDERDIAKRLEQIREELEYTDGLAFDGEPMSEEAKESFLEAMEFIVRQTKMINKKYTPKKYRKEKGDE